VKPLWNRKVAHVLGRAAFAYLAVETSGGPHVTPVLFAATPDRLWFGIGRRTVKARSLSRRPSVAIVVADQMRSVAIRGLATPLDRLPVSPAELSRAPFALPAFASRNALEMAAFARDLLGVREPPQPLVPVSVRVESLDLLEGWSGDAVLGWMADGGPIALPARWDGRSRRARVPAAPLRSAGGPRTAAACVSVDESEGRGPLAKRGTMLRGTGRARVRGDVATVALEVERITRWKGFEVETAAAR
jgi:hypothetical protein